MVNKTEKWAAEEEMVRYRLQLSGREFEEREATVLQSMGLQRVGHNLVTEQQQQLIYNVVLVSGIRQSDSVTYTHTRTVF